MDDTSTFCDSTTCHVVIGGLIAYFDMGHLTASFARTLATTVGAKISAALGVLD